MVSIYNPANKFFKIFMGINTVVLLISGFLLLARFGVPHTGPYPTWIWAKLFVWLTLAVLPPVLIKRVPNATKKISIVFVLLILAAAFFGIYKPQ